MSTFTIADLHLSTLDSTNKSMEVFGRRWSGYTEKLKANWKRLVTDNDTVIIPGDISWALTLDEAKSDLTFLNSLPGKKILGKGNHDFWWTTMKKHNAFFAENGIDTISFLFNNAHETDDFIIAGTRGWYYDEDAQNAPNNTDFEKAYTNFTIRYPKVEITRDMLIEYNGKTYSIEYLNNIDEENIELEIQSKVVEK